MKYFAYGANLDEINMAFRCPDSVYIGKGILHGYRFDITSRGYASILKDPLATTHGIVWEISEHDEEALDAYEGVSMRLYRRQVVEINFGDGTGTMCMIYVATDQCRGEPEKEYFDNILENAIFHGFPIGYIEYLRGLQSFSASSTEIVKIIK
jgi:gamma-glutamylcyclotransferase (GGCT)/AIG2-like uncharacterized protein YtfP